MGSWEASFQGVCWWTEGQSKVGMPRREQPGEPGDRQARPGCEEQPHRSRRAGFRRSEMSGMVLLNCSILERVVSIISQFRS